MLSRYLAPADRYDEAFAAPGQPRSPWAPLANATAGLPRATLEGRAHVIRRAVDQDGITYNIYADPQGADRPWELDQLPLVIGADEWRFLARAIAQRARLLDAILADLYGQRRLIAEGLLPPALVYGHHNYLWPCYGWQPRGGTYLHLYGCDVGRSPDGRWWAIRDRTQGPSGAGYALQNRLIVAPLYGNTFRKMGVQRLAQFFRTLQRSLARSAPTAEGEAPLVALLTPGPYNETYFEHVFLARYLGFALVEGSDLTVRDERVYLKTLEGLRRVHVLLRRLDDEYCDPAALRADSAIGVPGLVAAARAGNVVLANALGAGVLEMPGLTGFLPAICERLLGEPLALPSVATWWCGEAPALEHVARHLPDLVVKPAFPSMRLPPTFGYELDERGRAELIERIRATPHAYVAQERVRLSQVPTWSAEHGRFEARGTGLRLFAVAAEGRYVVMPGALARVAPDETTDVVTMQRGGSSKDAWVLEGTRVVRETLIQSRLGVRHLVRGGPFSPSRAVENLFWMGRYAERIEDIARILRTTILRLIESDPTRASELDALVELCRETELFERASASANDEALLLAAVRDARLPNGLAANIGRLHVCGGQLRDRISIDNWHAIQRLARLVRTPPADLDAALALLDQVMPACTSLAGYALDDMTRDEAWRFLVIGRRLERMGFLAALLARVAQAREDERDAVLTGVLEVANSIITYRSRYQRVPEALPVFDLLVFDESNPHSVGFQLMRLVTDVNTLESTLGPIGAASAEGRRLLAALRGFDLTVLEPDRDDAGERALAALLDDCERFAYSLSDALSQRFFVHAASAAQRTMAA